MTQPIPVAPSRTSDAPTRIAAVPFWWHSMELAPGVVTPGHKTPAQLQLEWNNMRLPDLRGKTVLDINTWDGFFAFEAERRGAASVTALDYYVWSMDLKEHFRYWEECRAKGVYPAQYHTQPYFKPEALPGKGGFDLAHELLRSQVKPVVGNFMEIDLDSLGRFDVVFFLGSLYHMEDPLASLKRLAQVTQGLAVIETEAAEFPGHRSRALCEFFESGELNHESSNWWAPNERALAGLCRAAGFQRVEVVKGPSVWSGSRLLTLGKNLLKSRTLSPVWRYRAVVHAWK